MDEYIKKEAVIKFIENGLNNPDKTKSFGHDAIEIMAEVRYIPAADVVEVMRCKNCKNYELMKSNNTHFCNEFGGHVTEEDFCSRCARMDGEPK